MLTPVDGYKGISHCGVNLYVVLVHLLDIRMNTIGSYFSRLSLLTNPWMDSNWPDANGSPRTLNVSSKNHLLHDDRSSSCLCVANTMW
ncbi:hypothetical protein DPMN_001844 [Dreissena polymorpha]|uniref:Uncharacterized protein n=1 Tax=Dreissena polymorpha TaxID=45954 RepID=A0A9D4RT99_DREPO|nr:hypothetical protein DPMN_001844 [Dreissena polymorpha]